MASSPLRLWPLLLACWALPAGEYCCPEGWGLDGRSVKGGDTVAWCLHPGSSAGASEGEGRRLSPLQVSGDDARVGERPQKTVLSQSFLLPFPFVNVTYTEWEQMRKLKLRVQIRREDKNSISNL